MLLGTLDTVRNICLKINQKQHISNLMWCLEISALRRPIMENFLDFGVLLPRFIAEFYEVLSHNI